ncbi:MAG: radical SAM protein [Methanosarcinales archaeon Met12]|nr:MAG: radical SAM protein [Methanosarcinales archaeon Met12]
MVREMDHPCFDEDAHFRVGRIHLPVAPLCNIKCRFCVHGVCTSKCVRPGATSKIMTPQESIIAVEEAIVEDPQIKVVGIAGPGDPLVNAQTFETLEIIKDRFSQLITCLSTNGLLLPNKIRQLHQLGVDYVTVTVNAFTPQTADKIYEWLYLDGKKTKDTSILLRAQQLGVQLAHELDIPIKINTVLIPGVNEHEVEEIARWGSKYALGMNVMPLIPRGEFGWMKRPTCTQMNRARLSVSKHMRLFKHCKQCRTDAVGVPGEML